jgi:hypothetical protein
MANEVLFVSVNQGNWHVFCKGFSASFSINRLNQLAIFMAEVLKIKVIKEKIRLFQIFFDTAPAVMNQVNQKL